jgi:hypothetical protein
VYFLPGQILLPAPKGIVIEDPTHAFKLNSPVSLLIHRSGLYSVASSKFSFFVHATIVWHKTTVYAKKSLELRETMKMFNQFTPAFTRYPDKYMSESKTLATANATGLNREASWIAARV